MVEVTVVELSDADPDSFLATTMLSCKASRRIAGVVLHWHSGASATGAVVVLLVVVLAAAC